MNDDDDLAYSWELEGIGPLPGKGVPPKQSPKQVRPSRSFQGPPPPPPLSLSVFSKSSAATALAPLSPAAEEGSKVTEERGPPPEDPYCPIKGMYRLLDLIMEQGSSGLVDKIVIAQESLQAFINALSPGAYSSITKINFKILDDLSLRPIGVYGSKEEIVRFLSEMGSVDVEMAQKLLVPQGDYTSKGVEPILRSGLYIKRNLHLLWKNKHTLCTGLKIRVGMTMRSRWSNATGLCS